MSFYPIYLTRLSEKKVVLIGGDEEAERKAKELLDFNVRLEIINSTLPESLIRLYRRGNFRWIDRPYRYGDLEDAAFVVAAEYDHDTAETIAQEARERNILTNIMDNIPLSDSAFGSVIKQGDLTISFSTNGLAPALAVRLKEKLQREVDEAYRKFLELAKKLRPYINEQINDSELRKKLWYEWVDSEVIDLLRQNRWNDALKLTAEIWGEEIVVQKADIRVETISDSS